MTLKKGQRTHRLRKRIDLVHRASVLDTSQGYWVEMMCVSPAEIAKLVFQERHESGSPSRFCISPIGNKTDLLVFPVPDRDYKCEVLGSVYVKQ